MTIQALVVDNNPVLVRAISSFLARQGCEVQTAANGLEALTLLKSSIPDILFTDLVMPLIGGEQLCKIIRSNPRFTNIFLVIVSGIVLEDFENLLTEKYYDLCIAKGNLKELRSHVQDALKRMEEKRKGSKTAGEQLPARIPDGLKPSSVALELLREKRHLHHILEHLDEGIVELDCHGAVLSINSAACRTLGVMAERVIGSSLAEIPWGDHQEKIRQWLAKLASGAGEQLDIYEDHPVWINDRIVTATMMTMSVENVVYGLCILRDITRQYIAEEHERELSDAMKLMTKMEAMSCMAGGIAHDFNNLLTVICGNLDILMHLIAKEMTSDRRSLLEHARSAAYMAVDLTRKISSSSPFGIVSRQKQPLAEIVRNCVERFRQQSGADCELSIDDHGVLVNVNPDQIGAALSNILQNGMEAAGEAPVEVYTKEVTFEAPTILSGQYVPEGSYGCVAIHDYGTGIARENLLKVFDPYFSTKARGASKGMGLGLTVVYATMRNHGGYVVVDSAPGEGTTVFCYLPCYGHYRMEERQASGQHRVTRVMVVEHDIQLQEVARLMLEHLGYSVTIARDLEEAKRTLAGMGDMRAGEVLAVLIDPLQEVAADQRLICSQLADGRSVRVIATGSSLLDPVMQDFRSFGYHSRLVKPFSLDSLRQAFTMTMID